MTTARQCAVIGHPVAHSLSPRLHQAFGRQTGVVLNYERMDVNADEFERRVGQFFAGNGCGLNVTLPYKQQAYALAQQHTQAAQQAGAANTLWQREGVLWADNTDGIGLIRDLERLQMTLTGATIALIGAGGAAAGIIPALLASGVARIALSNRTPANAQTLIAHFADSRLQWGDEKLSCDLVISATTQGFTELAASLPTLANTLVYDLNYGDRAAVTKTWAQQRGLRFYDGMGMLIEQAAESFRQWHGLMPETNALHKGEF